MAKNFTPKEWLERIRNGQRFQNKFADSKKWETYKGYYRHQYGPGIIPVNMVYSLLRSMVPQVYFRNPHVTITPRKPGLEAELHARIVQSLDNWLLQELNSKQEMKKLISDSFLFGIGNGFFGYDSMYGYDPTKLEPGTSQYTLTQFDKKGFRIEYNNLVNPGMPWFLRARPEDVIWPWGCESSHTAEWVALRVFRPLEDVKADPKYKVPSDLKGTLIQSRTGPEGTEERDAATDNNQVEDIKGREWIEIFQVHDARTGQIMALTSDHLDGWLRDPQTDEMQIDGLPVETLCFNPDPDYIYGIPDARIIEPQLLEINEIRTQAMKHRRIDIVKALVKKGVFTEEAIQKMTDERVAAIVEVETDTALKDSIMSFTPNSGAVLTDLAGMAEQVRGDVREMVGFSRVAQGEFQGKTHVSATETKRVFQSMNIRLDERRDMMADLLTKVLRRFNQIIFSQWDQERVSRIVGPDGAMWWLKYTGQQIKDEYDMVVTPEEAPNLDTASKFDLGVKAAEVWATLNQGAIAQGAPVPSEIQRLIFNQFQGSGLDIDRLLAQANASSSQAQMMLQGMGQTQGSAVSPGLAAQAMGQARQ